MENPKDWKKQLLRIGSYIVVAALAASITYFTMEGGQQRSKLDELERLPDISPGMLPA